MFKKLMNFKNKGVEESIVSPITGTVTELSDVPDPVFAEKMMGNGIAVYPKEGEVVAPIDAEIIHMFPSNHALALKTAGGLELLIHIGLETIELDGEGFVPHVQIGEKVKAGQPLISFDIAYIEQHVPSIVVPIIITNSEVIQTLTVTDKKDVIKNQDMLMSIKIDNR